MDVRPRGEPALLRLGAEALLPELLRWEGVGAQLEACTVSMEELRVG